MLSIKKETLTELSPNELSGVVGGYEVSGGICFTIVIRHPDPESCFAASCITND